MVRSEGSLSGSVVGVTDHAAGLAIDDLAPRGWARGAKPGILASRGMRLLVHSLTTS
jgi:hypothetical protein